MELTHRFTVPVPIDDAWEHFNDIASVAECFPGATVTSVEGDTFHGSVKVKLGPIALVYNGTGTFTEKDEAEAEAVAADVESGSKGQGATTDSANANQAKMAGEKAMKERIEKIKAKVVELLGEAARNQEMRNGMSRRP